MPLALPRPRVSLLRLMQVAALDLRPGYLVDYQGRMATVVWWNILRNDRRLFVQMKLKDLETGRVSELKEHGDSKYEVLDKEEIDLMHSYRDGPEEVFYKENGEEVRCPVAAAEDALLWPSERYPGLFVNGHLVAVRAPRFSTLRIKETAPAIRGGGTGSKEAVLENGVTVKVGLLCETGELVRIETETLEFKERAGR
ncbi:MAG: elongation factor P [Planctomycetota bacterium]